MWRVVIADHLEFDGKEGGDRRGNNPPGSNPGQKVAFCHGELGPQGTQLDAQGPGEELDRGKDTESRPA